MNSPIRIVIADDHSIFRKGLVQTLSQFANCKVVAECRNAKEALLVVGEHLPDIVLLDVRMPGGGIEAARQIAIACPMVRPLILAASAKTSDVLGALEVGARGYVLKGIGGEELLNIVKTVHEGGVYISPGLVDRIQVDVKSQTGSFDAGPVSDLAEPAK